MQRKGHIAKGKTRQPKILSMWEKLTLVDEQGRTYTIKEKPDEFDYTKQDIKIVAYEFKDERTYQGGDTYET